MYNFDRVLAGYGEGRVSRAGVDNDYLHFAAGLLHNARKEPAYMLFLVETTNNEADRTHAHVTSASDAQPGSAPQLNNKKEAEKRV